MKKRWLSLLLVLSLLTALAVPIQALAADRWTALEPAGQYNPLYYDGSEMPPLPEEQAPVRMAGGSTYVSEKEAAAQLRDAMVARQDTVQLDVYTTNYWYNSAQDNWFLKDLFPMAYSQALAVGLTDGDYLRWSWRSVSTQAYTNGYEYSITVNLSYYTTAAQEQQFLADLDSTMAGLDLDTYPAADRYAAIYDFVTDHVTYDHGGLSEWQAQYRANGWDGIDRTYFEIYTAYAALEKGTAVCQGYATLVYAMCRWAELPVRVVCSREHSFNILNLKDIWYYADATYDAQTPTGRAWFLLGSDAFERDKMHTPEAEYCTAEYRASYPISALDYDPNTPFNDLEPGSWYYDAVGSMVDRGVMNGVGNSRFDPYGGVIRAMVAAVLYRLEGEPAVSGNSSFSDVPEGAYYQKAVAWAEQTGIVTGNGDNTFRPTDPVTREQLAAMLYRYARYLGEELPLGDLSAYPDSASVSSYAEAPMAWAVGAGIINGVEEGGVTRLKPQSGANRAQLAVMLDRFLEKTA